MNEEQRLVQKRLRVLEHAKKIGNVRKTCRYFGISRSSFYRWNKPAGSCYGLQHNCLTKLLL